MQQFGKDNVYKQKLEKAYQIAARVFSLYGDTYYPLFLRLHEELEAHERKMRLSEIAHKIIFDPEKLDKNDTLVITK